MTDQRREQGSAAGPEPSSRPRTRPAPPDLAKIVRDIRSCAPPESAAAPDRREEYGQAITNRLFGIGLDLHFVLGLTEHPEAAARVRAAIGDLDDVIKDFRRLVLSLDHPERL